MPRKKSLYLGNPQFQHLHIEDESEGRNKEICRYREIKTVPAYQLERRGSDGRVLTETEDVGLQQDDDFQPGSSGGLDGDEQNEPFQRSGRQSRGGRGGGSLSQSRPRKSIMGSPERELRVRLTRKLSSRMHAIRRFVDFTISHSDSSPRMFGIVKDEEDICSVKNGDFLFRVRLTFVPKRVDVEDPYVKDDIVEIKFRGRLFKYSEERDSFVELAVVSQCMAIGGTAERRRNPIEAATSIAPPDDHD